MEDTVIIKSLKEEQDEAVERGAGHVIPGKPIDKLNVKVDKLTLEIEALKRDMKIVIDHLNSQDKLKNKSQSWFY